MLARKLTAFTLLEVLASIALLVILLALAIPNYKQILANAFEVGCVSNMRGITVALHGYLQDHQAVWPQGPSPNEEADWEKFWLKALEPYGIAPKTWQCPGFNAEATVAGLAADERPRVHYIPTTFGPASGMAYVWEGQPWLVERANSHDKGPHIGFQDGSVKPFYKVLAEHGVR